jgi:hypothetical protein
MSDRRCRGPNLSERRRVCTHPRPPVAPLATPPAPLQALGWLSLLLPTHEALRGRGAWGSWAPRWLALWQQLDHCRYWDTLWLGLFARLAKHDLHGAPAAPAALRCAVSDPASPVPRCAPTRGMCGCGGVPRSSGSQRGCPGLWRSRPVLFF